MQASQDGEWFRNERGNLMKVYGAKPRGESKHADFPVPMMIASFAEPVQSMADGKYYGTPSDLYRSYRAENNPQGVDFEVMGNDQKPEIQKSNAPSKADRQKSRRESMARAEAKIARGEGVKLPD